jgi:Mrp family chromosome partitioning ATPase
MSVPVDQPHVEVVGDDARPPETLWLLWMRKRMILAVTAIVTGATLLQLSQKPPVYVSSAEVLVRPGSAKPGGVDNYEPVANMEPARRMATSAVVRSGAHRRLGRPGPMPPITVTAPKDSYTLVFSASSTTPVMAQRIVTAYVESYVQVRHEDVLQDLAEAREPIERRLAEVNQEIESASNALLGAPESARPPLQTRLAALLAQRQSLEQSRDGLDNPADRQVAQVLQPATLPKAPAGPNHLKFLALATSVGAALGIGAAFAGSLLSPRVQGRRAVAAEVRAPVLALIGASPWGRRRLVVASDSESRQAEEYHVLAATLQRLVERDRLRSLIVTSPNPREGKSSIVANLAVALARTGTRTVIFPADGGNGVEALFPRLNDEAAAGVSRESPPLTVRPVSSVRGLGVASAGASPLAPFNLRNPAAVRLIVERLSAVADLVIFDGPPVLRKPEMLVMAPLVDAVIIVAAADRTTTGSLHEASVRLQLIGANVIGAVLTGVSAARIWFEGRFDRQTERRLVERPTAGAGGRRTIRVGSESLDEPAVT